METVALGIFVFQLTESPFWVALVGFLRMVPLLLLGPWIGLISDRMDRKILIGSTMGILAPIYVALAVLAITNRIELWQVCIGAALAGVMWATDLPVRRAMIADAMSNDGISTAIGIDMATSNFSRVIGPLGAGAFLSTVGIEAAYVTGAVLCGIGSALAFSSTSVTSGFREVQRSGYFTNLAEGLRHLRTDRIVVVTLIITIIMNMFAFPYQHMIPVIGSETLMVGPLLVGLLLATEGFGATIGSLVIAAKARHGGFTRIYTIGSVTFLAAIMLFSLSPSYWTALPALLIGGFSMAGFATMQSVIVITSTPAEFRGRVLGVLAASIGTGPLGTILVGVFAVWWGANNAVTVLATTGLIMIVGTLIIWPRFLASSITHVRTADIADSAEDR